ncbi:flagellar hook-associated protein FlgK [Thiomicrorhabdus sp. ZW0627]|uniref:flagellar hook-associated protein FlgK n=1 Tax=Thiomicrorhabdus sp. ZW0627 TaxID=3039774 RepID=UPI002436FE1D|nr:flagellar hook-associated protein FlgK [Thiomicrorhabdus sp. ZW0627]MDG6773369.1 flagellar hook-associated protein FlgK [Thiomicrorhabdus sp. ZW0627]
MADMLSIGSSAANTYKTALDVTSHNIANVSTEGYSRQRAEIMSSAPGLSSVKFSGSGSYVDTVMRIQADYIQMQLNSSNASVQRYDQQLQLSKQVEGIVSGTEDGVQVFIQSFFDSLQEAADNPTSSTSRQMVLNEAGNIESHLNNLSTVFTDTQQQVNSQIKSLSDEINDRLKTIQSVNDQVERGLASGSQPPNDLLDQRDQAILELSGYIGIKTYPQENGRIDIHTANGQLPLLSDNTITELQAKLGPYGDENRIELYATIGGEDRVVSDRITGGQLGGILDFRSNMLDVAQNELGLTMNGFVASMNWQHYQGYDLNGDAGGSLFEPLASSAIKNANNDATSDDGSGISISFNPPQPAAGFNGEPPYTPATQPATYGDKEEYLQNAFTSIGEMEPREYLMIYNGTTGNFDVYDRQNESLLLGSFANDPLNPTIIDGLEFKGDGGTYAAGDRFISKPHQDVLDQFHTLITDSDLIASRGQSQIDSNNDGLLTDEVPAPAAYGDNVNIANMANLQSKKILLSDNNGAATESLLGGFAKMTSNAGMYVRSSEIQLNAQTNVHAQMLNQRDSLSGVSLDEEAANLMKFQQAYEASAQIIATSQSIFQTLLGAVRG